MPDPNHADLLDERSAPDATTVQELLSGLTDEQVARRREAGLVNVNTDVKTKSLREIVAEHALTLFNGVNLALAILVCTTGQFRNAAFMGVVLINLVVGVSQELRAKQMVDRLTILTAKRVMVVRGGERIELDVEDIVIDDVVLLAHGDQVPADGVVLDGQPLVDESLLTGESDSIEKHVGDELFSGSFVVAGSVTYRVTRVGEAGYAARINAEARYVKPVNSEIMRTVRMIIEFAAIVIAPLGLGLFLRTVGLEGTTTRSAILSTVAAMVGMIPQGLVLLTSGVLAIATTILGRHDVLVQQSYCVETLARVDTLCLDKTGTITSGAMEVAEVRAMGDARDEDVERAFASVTLANVEDANETAKALIDYAERRGALPEPTLRSVPFSSARKYSGCVTREGNAYVLGAAQFVLGSDAASYADTIASFGERERVLVVAKVDGFDESGSLQGSPLVLGFAALRDEIRSTAADTIAYFHEQGVDLKVISGDDPRTVSAIAKAVGIDSAEDYVDATTLLTDEDVERAAVTKHVFGRVTPQQKRTIVRALRKAGHTVAMTGDGVNDVLALKEADCSVSMSSGSAAARNVSEIVLVDNDFAHMPEVVAEGRRSINNLQRSAALFLVKTVFSALLALVCIVLPPYPFIPIQMTLLSSAVIGWPSFVLSMEPNHERVTGDFLANVLRRSLPASAAIVCAVLSVQMAKGPLGLTYEQASTCSLYLSALVGFLLIVRISQPLNPLRIALLVSVVGIFLIGSVGVPWFFSLSTPTVSMALFLAASGAVTVGLFHMLYERLNGSHAQGDALSRLVGLLEKNYDRRQQAHRAASKQGA